MSLEGFPYFWQVLSQEGLAESPDGCLVEARIRLNKGHHVHSEHKILELDVTDLLFKWFF